MKTILTFIFIVVTVLCTSIIAQEYTADYWHQKGDGFYKNNSYDLALRCYDKAIEINPRDANAWHNKGDILKELGRTKEADASFDKATEPGYMDSTPMKITPDEIIIETPVFDNSTMTEITPDMIMARDSKPTNVAKEVVSPTYDITYSLNKYYDSLGYSGSDRYIYCGAKPTEIYNLYNHLKENNFTELEVYEMNSRCWDISGAISGVDDILKQEPIDPIKMAAYNASLKEMLEWAVYNETNRKIYKIILNRTSSISEIKAEIFSRLGDNNAALECINQGIELETKETTLYGLWLKKADILEVMGRYDEAIEAREMEIKILDNLSSQLLDPVTVFSLVFARNHLMEYLVNLSKYEKAIQVCDDLIEMEPILKVLEESGCFYEGFDAQKIYHNKGIALEALGRTKEADAAYAKAREYDRA
jgi:tetratricopeptide (TPR) repeat protein